MPKQPLVVDVQIGKECDIGKLSPHDLRRTMATLLIEAGMIDRYSPITND